MKVEVLTAEHGVGDGSVLAGGVHEIDVTAEVAPLLAGAASAGVLVVVDATDDERALLDGHVQSQADGEAEYGRAVEDGRWLEGDAWQTGTIQTETDETETEVEA